MKTNTELLDQLVQEQENQESFYDYVVSLGEYVDVDNVMSFVEAAMMMARIEERVKVKLNL